MNYRMSLLCPGCKTENIHFSRYSRCYICEECGSSFSRPVEKELPSGSRSRAEHDNLVDTRRVRTFIASSIYLATERDLFGAVIAQSNGLDTSLYIDLDRCEDDRSIQLSGSQQELYNKWISESDVFFLLVSDTGIGEWTMKEVELARENKSEHNRKMFAFVAASLSEEETAVFTEGFDGILRYEDLSDLRIKLNEVITEIRLDNNIGSLIQDCTRRVYDIVITGAERRSAEYVYSLANKFNSINNTLFREDLHNSLMFRLSIFIDDYSGFPKDLNDYYFLVTEQNSNVNGLISDCYHSGRNRLFLDVDVFGSPAESDTRDVIESISAVINNNYVATYTDKVSFIGNNQLHSRIELIKSNYRVLDLGYEQYLIGNKFLADKYMSEAYEFGFPDGAYYLGSLHFDENDEEFFDLELAEKYYTTAAEKHGIMKGLLDLGFYYLKHRDKKTGKRVRDPDKALEIFMKCEMAGSLTGYYQVRDLMKYEKQFSFHLEAADHGSPVAQVAVAIELLHKIDFIDIERAKHYLDMAAMKDYRGVDLNMLKKAQTELIKQTEKRKQEEKTKEKANALITTSPRDPKAYEEAAALVSSIDIKQHLLLHSLSTFYENVDMIHEQTDEMKQDNPDDNTSDILNKIADNIIAEAESDEGDLLERCKKIIRCNKTILSYFAKSKYYQMIFKMSGKYEEKSISYLKVPERIVSRARELLLSDNTDSEPVLMNVYSICTAFIPILKCVIYGLFVAQKAYSTANDDIVEQAHDCSDDTTSLKKYVTCVMEMVTNGSLKCRIERLFALADETDPDKLEKNTKIASSMASIYDSAFEISKFSPEMVFDRKIIDLADETDLEKLEANVQYVQSVSESIQLIDSHKEELPCEYYDAITNVALTSAPNESKTPLDNVKDLITVSSFIATLRKENVPQERVALFEQLILDEGSVDNFAMRAIDETKKLLEGISTLRSGKKAFNYYYYSIIPFPGEESKLQEHTEPPVPEEYIDRLTALIGGATISEAVRNANYGLAIYYVLLCVRKLIKYGGKQEYIDRMLKYADKDTKVLNSIQTNLDHVADIYYAATVLERYGADDVIITGLEKIADMAAEKNGGELGIFITCLQELSNAVTENERQNVPEHLLRTVLSEIIQKDSSQHYAHDDMMDYISYQTGKSHSCYVYWDCSIRSLSHRVEHLAEIYKYGNEAMKYGVPETDVQKIYSLADRGNPQSIDEHSKYAKPFSAIFMCAVDAEKSGADEEEIMAIKKHISKDAEYFAEVCAELSVIYRAAAGLREKGCDDEAAKVRSLAAEVDDIIVAHENAERAVDIAKNYDAAN